MKPIRIIIYVMCILLCFPARVSAKSSDHVTVKGTVYIWNLDLAEAGDATMGVNSNIPGGRYLPAQNLAVEVEFGGLNVDKETYTDKYGQYKITKGNPWWGKYSVNVEVRASVLLGEYIFDGNDIRPIIVEMFPAGEDWWLVYEGRFNIYPYNGETDSISVGSGETVTMDVYIGGPGRGGGYSITDWWDDYPGDHLIGFYSVQAIQEAYHWAVSRAITPEDISRHTYILYRANISSKAKYQPFAPPPGIGHILVSSHQLYPNDGVAGARIGPKWQDYRGKLIHEFGHKIMHDVYTFALPTGFQSPVCTHHSVDTTITGECGFIEGWAEFFPAAVLGRPTLNGQPGSNNLEHTYHPDPGLISQANEGFFTWRENVTQGRQSSCEGENAAVFWDIYDPKGWEYMLPVQQAGAQRLTFAWPVPLRWYDRLNDNNLDDIWTILKEDDPDRMYDEINTGLWGWFNDGFYKYWRNRFSNDGDKIHGLKAILFNREIETWPLDQTAPSIQVLNVDQNTGIATLSITEADQEDRPYLYYNIAYRNDEGDQPQVLLELDMPVSELASNWQGDTLIVEVQLPNPNTSHDYILMVHDSMGADFEELSINVEGDEDDLDEIDQDWCHANDEWEVESNSSREEANVWQDMNNAMCGQLNVTDDWVDYKGDYFYWTAPSTGIYFISISPLSRNCTHDLYVEEEIGIDNEFPYYVKTKPLNNGQSKEIDFPVGLTFEASQGKNYYFQIIPRDLHGGTAEYRLILEFLGDHRDVCAGALPLPSGLNYTSQLTVDDKDCFRLWKPSTCNNINCVDQGGTLTITLPKTPAGFSTDLELFQYDTGIFDFENESRTSLSKITFAAGSGQNGEYTILNTTRVGYPGLTYNFPGYINWQGYCVCLSRNTAGNDPDFLGDADSLFDENYIDSTITSCQEAPEIDLAVTQEADMIIGGPPHYYKIAVEAGRNYRIELWGIRARARYGCDNPLMIEVIEGGSVIANSTVNEACKIIVEFTPITDEVCLRISVWEFTGLSNKEYRWFIKPVN